MPLGNPNSPPAFDVVLYEPEIPPNAGNIMRLCANTGCRLHLVRPLGFSLRDKQLQRAGLDYRARAAIEVHETWTACRAFLTGRRWFGVTTRGMQRYDRPTYRAGDVFVFGPETRGLPDTIIGEFGAEHRIRLPMRPGSRSLNLANAVAVVVYEAWRQIDFRGSRENNVEC
ncbi:MAG TPA: tRNA (cytidine(34)-2'-O)-methyltransferase [Burkholderiales bacterium]|nr:tRNA (cytidine(34)-2'-O)-methyltransferase [Burkholderiales bacterium]